LPTISTTATPSKSHAVVNACPLSRAVVYPFAGLSG
jgi:hypothetical protein